MRGKSAIITGSTSGIGLSIARHFASEGCNILMNGFGEPSKIDEIRKSIEAETGVTALYSSANMMNPEEISMMVSEAKRRFANNKVNFYDGKLRVVDCDGKKSTSSPRRNTGTTWRSMSSRGAT